MINGITIPTLITGEAKWICSRLSEKIYYDKVLYFEHNGYTYSLTHYTDKWYEGIAPVYCLQNEYMAENGFYYESYETPANSINELCVFRFGESLAIPLFNHYGASGSESMSTPKSCSW